jgi:hypothetical protein
MGVQGGTAPSMQKNAGNESINRERREKTREEKRYI